MHPRTREVLAYLDAQRATLEQAVAAVPPERRGRRPAADRWSVAEVLEHLALVEGRIATLLDEQLAASRRAGLGTDRETTPVVETLDLARVTDRSRRLTASEASRPRGETDAETAWRALEAQRGRTRAMIVAADGLALGDVTIPHPRLGPLNVYQWLAFLGGHEARHADQIRELAADAGPSVAPARAHAERA